MQSGSSIFRLFDSTLLSDFWLAVDSIRVSLIQLRRYLNSRRAFPGYNLKQFKSCLVVSRFLLRGVGVGVLALCSIFSACLETAISAGMTPPTYTISVVGSNLVRTTCPPTFHHRALPLNKEYRPKWAISCCSSDRVPVVLDSGLS